MCLPCCRGHQHLFYSVVAPASTAWSGCPMYSTASPGFSITGRGASCGVASCGGAFCGVASCGGTSCGGTSCGGASCGGASCGGTSCGGASSTGTFRLLCCSCSSVQELKIRATQGVQSVHQAKKLKDTSKKNCHNRKTRGWEAEGAGRGRR